MQGHSLVGRRQLLKLLAAVGAGGAAGSSTTHAYALPADALMIGCGGAGCKVARRAIGLGFSPAGFVTIDSDANDLALSGAAHQIQCPQNESGRGWPTVSEDWAHPQIDALLVPVSKVVLVGGLGGGMGMNWLFEIAGPGGVVDSHVLERGLKVDVVATMPRSDEPYREWNRGSTVFRHIRSNPLVKTYVDCSNDLPRALPPAPVLERELWLTRQALLCALGQSGPSLAA